MRILPYFNVQQNSAWLMCDTGGNPNALPEVPSAVGTSQSTRVGTLRASILLDHRLPIDKPKVCRQKLRVHKRLGDM